MPTYSIKISLVGRPEPLLVELPGFDQQRAELFTADLRHEIQQAVIIDAPFVQVQVAGTPEVTLDPSSISELDLQED